MEATREENEEENELESGTASTSVPPVPLALLYEAYAGQETFSDPEALAKALPEAPGVRSEEIVRPSAPEVPQLPPRSPLEAESEESLETAATVDTQATFEVLKTPVSAARERLYPNENVPEPASAPRVPRREELEMGHSVQVVDLNDCEGFISHGSDSRFMVNFVNEEELRELILKIENEPYVNPNVNRIAAIHVGDPDDDDDDMWPHYDAFKVMVSDYRHSEEQMQFFQARKRSQFHEVETKRGTTWVKKTGIAQQTQDLRVGLGKIKAEVTFAHANFSQRKAKTLLANMVAFDKMRSNEEIEFALTRRKCLVRIEQFLRVILSSSAEFCPWLSPHVKENGVTEKIQACLDVLLVFYKSTLEELEQAMVEDVISWRNRFILQIEKWSLFLGSALLQRGKFDDHAFLMKEILCCSSPASSLSSKSQWLLSLLEFCSTSSPLNEDSIDQFISLFEHILRQKVESEPSQRSDFGHFCVRHSQALPETNFIALLEHVPLKRALQEMLPQEIVQEDNEGNLRQRLIRVRHLSSTVCEAMTQNSSNVQAGKTLAQILHAISSKCAHVLDQSFGMSVKNLAMLQVWFDFIVLGNSVALLSAEDQNLRILFGDLPLGHLSLEASWKLFVALSVNHVQNDLQSCASTYGYWEDDGNYELKQPGETFRLDIVDQEISSADSLFYAFSNICCKSSWFEALRHHDNLRQCVYRSLGDEKELEKDGLNEAQCLFLKVRVSMLAKLTHSFDLAEAALFSLVQANFATMSSGSRSRDITLFELIGNICLKHPALISGLLHFMSDHEGKMVESGAACTLFRALPIEKWVPDEPKGDIAILKRWLPHVGTSDTLLRPQTVLAMLILENIDLENVPHRVHLKIAILIVEACMKRVVHSTARRVASGSSASSVFALRRLIPMTQAYNEEREAVQFERWCWMLVLRLTLVNPKTFHRTVSAIDMLDSHDRNNGGSLRRMWNDVSRKSDEELDEEEGTAHPILAYVLLIATDFSRTDNWAPLTALFRASSSRKVKHREFIQMACLKVIRHVLPSYAFELHAEEADFHFKRLPAASEWLHPFLDEISTETDGIMEVASAASSAVVNSLVSRVTASLAGSPSVTEPIARELSRHRSSNSLEVFPERGILKVCQLIKSHLSSKSNPVLANALALFWLDCVQEKTSWYQLEHFRQIADCIFAGAWVASSKSPQSSTQLILSTRLAEYIDLSESLTILPEDSTPSFFGKQDAKKFNCEWVSFHALLIETGKEFPLWKAMGAMLTESQNLNRTLDQLKGQIPELLKQQNIVGDDPRVFMHDDFKKLSSFRIYRWAEYALNMSPDHPLLVLYWQMLMSLFLSHHGRNLFGFRFFQRSKRQTRRAFIREDLVNRCHILQMHFEEQHRISSSSSSKTLNEKKCLARQRKTHESIWKNRSSSTSSTANAGLERTESQGSLSPESQIARARAKELARLFKAMGLWLGDADPSKWLGNGTSTDISAFGRDICTERLETLLGEFPLQQMLHQLSTSSRGDKIGAKFFDLLWTDLVSLESEERLIEGARSAFMLSETSRLLCDRFKEASRRRRRRFGSICGLPNHGLDDGQANSESPHPVPPVYLYREPLLPKDLDFQKFSLEEAFKVFEKASHTHRKSFEKTKQLSLDYVDTLPHLYSTRTRVEHVEKFASTKQDKEPYHFEIEFIESVLDTNVDHKLGVMWEEWRNQNFGWRIDHCTQVEDKVLLECQMVSECVRQLGEALHDPTASENDKVHAADFGKRWFRRLVNFESSMNRTFPPVQRTLWSAIAKLGKVFALGDAEECHFVLHAMLHDTFRIPLLSRVFSLESFPERSMDFFSTLCEASPRLKAKDLLRIVHCIPFERFLELDPPADVRVEMVKSVEKILRQYSWNAEGDVHDEQVLVLHLELLKNVSNHVSDGVVFFQVVRSVVGMQSNSSGLPVALNSRSWSVLLHLDCHHIDSVVLLECMREMTEHFWRLRNKGSGDNRTRQTSAGSLVRQWRPLNLIDSFCALSLKLVKQATAELRGSGDRLLKLELWKALVELFLPWVLAQDPVESPSSPSPALQAQLKVNFRDQARKASADEEDIDFRGQQPSALPWPALKESSTSGNIVIQGMVKCMLEVTIAAEEVEKLQTLDLVWWLYFDRLSVEAPRHVSMAFVDALMAELPWNKWVLSWPFLLHAITLVESHHGTHPHFQFVLRALMKMDWTSLCSQYSRPSRSGVFMGKDHGDFKDFLFLSLDLLFKILCKVEDADFDEFVQTTLRVLQLVPWHEVSPEKYKVLSDRVLIKVVDEEKRFVAGFRILGALSFVGIRHDVDSLKKEQMHIRVICGLLNNASKDGSPCSPGAFVMILFQSLKRLHAAMKDDEAPWEHACASNEGVHMMVTSSPYLDAEITTLQALLRDLVDLGNVALGAIVRPDLFAKNGSAFADDESFADVIFGKIDNVMKAVQSTMWSVKGSRSGENESKTGDSAALLEGQSLWSSWKRMCKPVIGVMVSAGTVARKRKTNANHKNERKLGSRRLSWSSKSVDKGHLESDEHSTTNEILGAGCGAVLAQFVHDVGSCAPLILHSCLLVVNQKERLMEIMENTLDGCLENSNDLGPVLIAFSHVYPIEEVEKLEDVAIARGAWRLLYVLELRRQQINTNSERVFRIAGVIHRMVQAQTAGPTFLNPAKVSLLPMIALFIEVLSERQGENVELLFSVLDDVAILEGSRNAGIFLTVASAIYGRISGESSKDSAVLERKRELCVADRERILLNAVQAFLLVNSRQGSAAKLRLDPEVMPLNKASAENLLSGLRKEGLEGLRAVDFILDESRSLSDYRGFFDDLGVALFPDEAFLRRSSKEWEVEIDAARVEGAAEQSFAL